MKNYILNQNLFLVIVLSFTFTIATFTVFSFTLVYSQTNTNISNNKTMNLNDTLMSSTLSNMVSFPIDKGYANGKLSYFISTDASEKMIVSSIANTTNHTVNYAPTLSQSSESSRQQGYVFTNGIKANGTFNYQLPVASATAGDQGYSPLFQINYVKWNNESKARILKSVAEIMNAQANGEISIVKSNIVINSPSVDLK